MQLFILRKNKLLTLKSGVQSTLVILSNKRQNHAAKDDKQSCCVCCFAVRLSPRHVFSTLTEGILVIKHSCFHGGFIEDTVVFCGFVQALFCFWESAEMQEYWWSEFDLLSRHRLSSHHDGALKWWSGLAQSTNFTQVNEEISENDILFSLAKIELQLRHRFIPSDSGNSW